VHSLTTLFLLLLQPSQEHNFNPKCVVETMRGSPLFIGEIHMLDHPIVQGAHQDPMDMLFPLSLWISMTLQVGDVWGQIC